MTVFFASFQAMHIHMILVIKSKTKEWCFIMCEY